MNEIKNASYEEERPLFGLAQTRLEHVAFHPGESAVKHAHDIYAAECTFMSKYPFWHNQNTVIESCVFEPGSRAAIWYSSDIRMIDSRVMAPKMFREVTELSIRNTKFTDGLEFGWNCHHIELMDVDIQNGDYLLMNSSDIAIDRLHLQGNYSFQDVRHAVIRNSVLDSKDAFWNSEDITVFDSVLNGEYLGWHSKNLRLVNCTISGEQPLCYATNLIMENCTMINTDRCFEYSMLQADIVGSIDSVTNPKAGYIKADHIGRIIIDEYCVNPGGCEIIVGGEALH